MLGWQDYIVSAKKADAATYAFNPRNTPSVLSPTSFDKTNERTLLALIHYLLSLLDPLFKTRVTTVPIFMYINVCVRVFVCL